MTAMEKLRESGKVFIYHIRTESSGNVTIAVQYKNDNMYIAGLAFCAPGDMFSRKQGVLIAKGRLSVGSVHNVKVKPQGIDTAGDLVPRIVDSVLMSDVCPYWFTAFSNVFDAGAHIRRK